MHAVRGGEKGLFLLVSPYQSLTGSNADHWLACAPGSEAVVALGLVRRMLAAGRGGHLPTSLREALARASAAYTPETVSTLAGLAPAACEKLAGRLEQARRPLVLGAGSGLNDDNGLKTNLAANLLNLMLDPQLARIDTLNRHRVESADRRSDVLDLFRTLSAGGCDLLILNNVNPVFSLPAESRAREALSARDLFVVSLGSFIDETSQHADLILPVTLPLETWDEYGGWSSIVATLQPAMGRLSDAPHLGDVILEAGFENDRPAPDFKTYVATRLHRAGRVRDELQWLETLQHGGLFTAVDPPASPPTRLPGRLPPALAMPYAPPQPGLAITAAPSVRLFDGRGANKPWLCEIPDPLSRVAWQSPVWLHPDTARAKGVEPADILRVETRWGSLEAPAYVTEVVHPGLALMGIGQGHTSYGRTAQNAGANPFAVLPAGVDPACGGPSFTAFDARIEKTGRSTKLAHTDGSRIQHGRTFIVTTTLADLRKGPPPAKTGLTMGDFPLTLPLPEGYSRERDFYPPHDHDRYRWAMVVDLDRCIGCGACAAGCMAENNIGIAGEKLITQGREMAWMSIERYHDERRMERVMFLPMLCHALRQRTLRVGLPGLCAPPLLGGAEQPDLQPLHRHALLLPELPLQGAALQLVHLRVAGAAEPAAEPRCDRAQQGRHGEMLVLHPAHQGGAHHRQERKPADPGRRGHTGLCPDLPDRGPGFRKPHGQGKPRAQALRRPAGLPGHGIPEHEAGGDIFEEGFTRGMRICRVRGSEGSRVQVNWPEAAAAGPCGS